MAIDKETKEALAETKKNIAEIEVREKKLGLVEKDLKDQADGLDRRMAELATQEGNIDKKLNILASSDVYTRAQEIINEAYTLCSSHGLAATQGFEAIKLVWDARHKFEVDFGD